MRRIETVATVTHDGILTIPMPADVRPGPHTVLWKLTNVLRVPSIPMKVRG